MSQLHPIVAAFVMTCAFVAGPVAAQDRVPTREEARAMFREAERLYAQRSYAQAAAHFEAAYRTLPHPSVLYNIAQCYEQLRQPARAIRNYQRYLASAGRSASDRDQVRRRIQALRALVAEVRLSGVSAGVDVFVDGRLEGRAPGPILVDPGRREIRVGGRRSSMEVQAGDVRLLALDGRRATSPAVVPRVIGWVLAGIGAASFGASWAFWAELQSREDAFAVANPMLPGFIERQGEVDDAVPPVLVAGGAGAGLSTIGMPLLLPSEGVPPWWAWVIGGLGLVPTGVGVYVLASEGDCVDTARCTRRERTAVLGSLLLMHAAPLVAVPIAYLLRAALDDDDGDTSASRVMLRVARGGVDLMLSGAF